MQLSAKAAQLSLQNTTGLQREIAPLNNILSSPEALPCPSSPSAPDLEPVRANMKKWMQALRHPGLEAVLLKKHCKPAPLDK